MASLENYSLQQQPVLVRPLAAAERMKACMDGTSAVLGQPVAAPGPSPPTQLPHLGLLSMEGASAAAEGSICSAFGRGPSETVTQDTL